MDAVGIEMKIGKRALALCLFLCLWMPAGTARASGGVFVAGVDGSSLLSSESSNEEIIFAYLTETVGLNTADGAYAAASWYCLNWEKPVNMDDQAVARGNLAKNTFWPKYCPIGHEPVSADSVRWRVAPEAFAGTGCVIVTAYDQNGRLTDHKLFPVDDPSVGASGTAALNTAENGYYKVLLVDMQTFSPLTFAQSGAWTRK